MGIRLDVGPGWNVSVAPALATAPAKNQPVGRRFTVTLAADVPLSSKPYFERTAFQDARYLKSDASQFGRPSSAPPAVAVVTYSVDGVPVAARETVTRREAKLPYGYVMRELRVRPGDRRDVEPGDGRRARRGLTSKRFMVSVDVLNNREAGSQGRRDAEAAAGLDGGAGARAVRLCPCRRTRARTRFTVTHPVDCGSRIHDRSGRARPTDANTARATKRSSIATSSRASSIARRRPTCAASTSRPCRASRSAT